MNLLPQLFAASLSLGLSLTAHAELDATQRGLQIAQEVKKRESGFQSARVDIEMVLVDRQGQSSTRRLRNSIIEGRGDKNRLVFDAPPDVRGTVFLSFTNVDRADEQWLYLPALKRTKRIASDNKAGSFMGSEFAFEDIASQEVEKFTYKYLGDDAVGRASFKLERIPRDEGSGYTRQIMWVDAERHVPLKIEYFDRRNELQKTLVYTDYQLYDAQFWKPANMTMSNHQNGKSTVLKFSSYRFRAGVTAQELDPQRIDNER